MAPRLSLRCLTAALVAGLALSLAPTEPVLADGDPGVRRPRVRVLPPRVRVVHHVRTVKRVRTCVVCYPPRHDAVHYYAPRYYAAGGAACAHSVALPYYWAVQYARYRHAHNHY